MAPPFSVKTFHIKFHYRVICIAIQLLKGIIQRILDLKSLGHYFGRKDHIKNQVYVVRAAYHPEIVNGDSFILLTQYRLHNTTEAGKFQIVGNDWIVMDNNMCIKLL